MQDQSSTVSICLSFSSYHYLSDIAAKVTQEGNDLSVNQNDDAQRSIGNGSGSDEEDDFEFVSVRENRDEIETAVPIFPLFDRELLDHSDNDNHDDLIKLPLRSLFIDNRDPPSSSSSESDELEGVSPGTYCVWTPSTPSPARCQKSNSTGSSTKQQRWRLRDLLHLKRSKSEGKEAFVFLNKNDYDKEKKKLKEEIVKGKAKEKSAHEVMYARNKALKNGEKRRSYLPYRQGIVGFFC